MGEYLKKIAELKDFLIPSAVTIAIIIVALIVRSAVFKVLRGWGGRTASRRKISRYRSPTGPYT